jgi:hypothetical protein
MQELQTVRKIGADRKSMIALRLGARGGMDRRPGEVTSRAVRPRCSVFIAVSLDGFIARRDGGIDWLSIVERPGEDYGYARAGFCCLQTVRDTRCLSLDYLACHDAFRGP